MQENAFIEAVFSMLAQTVFPFFVRKMMKLPCPLGDGISTHGACTAVACAGLFCSSTQNCSSDFLNALKNHIEREMK